MTITGVVNFDREILGVGFGGVIAEPVDCDLEDSREKSRPIPGALFGIKELVNKKFGTDVYVVSRCSRKDEQKILDWFSHQNFWWYTGIPDNHVIFCREYHEKTGIVRELGLTHFIDDRIDDLMYMLKYIKHPFLLLPPLRMSELRGLPMFGDRIKLAVSFPEIVQEILSYPKLMTLFR